MRYSALRSRQPSLGRGLLLRRHRKKSILPLPASTEYRRTDVMRLTLGRECVAEFATRGLRHQCEIHSGASIAPYFPDRVEAAPICAFPVRSEAASAYFSASLLHACRHPRRHYGTQIVLSRRALLHSVRIGQEDSPTACLFSRASQVSRARGRLPLHFQDTGPPRH
jgi:hypothetical protein